MDTLHSKLTSLTHDWLKANKPELLEGQTIDDQLATARKYWLEEATKLAAATTMHRAASPSNALDLRATPGANIAEKCIAYLKKQDPDFAKKPWAVQCKEAARLRRSCRVIM